MGMATDPINDSVPMSTLTRGQARAAIKEFEDYIRISRELIPKARALCLKLAEKGVAK